MKKAGSRRQQELLLTAALARFRDVEMPARNLSPQTRRGYGYDLSEWVATTAPSLTVAACPPTPSPATCRRWTRGV